jgi:hypothetical protein
MILPCSPLYILLHWSAMSTGTTNYEDCEAILFDYFPSKLHVEDLDAFSLVCGKWLECGGLKNFRLSTSHDVLRRMVEGAKVIRLANLGSSDEKPCEGQQWICWLHIDTDELTKQHGTLFRELLHTLAECYCQHAFAGNQAHIRTFLHGSLERAHDDLDTCEWPDCAWRSHECDFYGDSGRCTFLPKHSTVDEYAADDNQAPSPPPEASQPSTSSYAEPFNQLVKACGDIRAALVKSRRRTPAASLHDEEQGRRGGDFPLETLDPNLVATTHDPDSQAVRTPSAGMMDPSAHEDDENAASAVMQSLAYGTKGFGDKTTQPHASHYLHSGAPASSSRSLDQAKETEDQILPASVRPIDSDLAASYSGCGEAGMREPSTLVGSMGDSGKPLESLDTGHVSADADSSPADGAPLVEPSSPNPTHHSIGSGMDPAPHVP